MTYTRNQAYIPPTQVAAKQPVAASANLRSTLQFFDVMKSRMIQDYADPSPAGSMTIKGQTLVGQARYGAVGTFLLGQWFQDHTNIIESLTNALAFETSIFQTISKLF